jgi:hypothetical protein
MIGSMSPWILVVLTCLAVHRITRMVTRDHLPLISVPRERVVNYLDPPTAVDGIPVLPTPTRPWGTVGWALAFLLECDWCMSVWVAASVVAIEDVVLHLGWLWTVLLGLSASTVTGLIAQHEPE